ncbi:expressed unknown protein [Seminavis robusta]|uniref:Secreted protein n=1 Tax=Seminavis robusta TaxID=568900 RepID=A0A9N8E867_9STRA|nr:expressed unknown protein [Seminavis robusta]|eukprot:Sro726_g193500.1 n/a (111) ;mRNA; r:36335-36667
MTSLMRIVVLLVAVWFQGTTAMNLANGFQDGIFPLFPTVAGVPFLCDSELLDMPWWVCENSAPGGDGSGGSTYEDTTTEETQTFAGKANPKNGGNRKLHSKKPKNKLRGL